jgi:transposase
MLVLSKAHVVRWRTYQCRQNGRSAQSLVLGRSRWQVRGQLAQDFLLGMTAPELVSALGIGTDAASALLVSAGDNPERLRNEAAFAHLCGASPIDASSGKNQRHRLNRGGDRQANSALWHIVITRMVYDPRTAEYIDRRRKEGLTKKEAVRCLKRYVAREVYTLLPHEKLGA